MPSRHAVSNSARSTLPLLLSRLGWVLFALALPATGAGMLTDLDTLQRPTSPNTWLIAPSGSGAVDDEAPELPVPAAHLAATWQQVVAAQPRSRVTVVSSDGLQVEAEQKSALFGFVDDVSFRAVPLDAGRSTYIAYSRSRVGYWDMGVNRRRLASWIGQLLERLDDGGQ